jgi:hypothetical protein
MTFQVEPDRNDLATRFPALAKEFDVERNFPLTPQTLAYASKKRVFWRCQKGHSYDLSVVNRTLGKQNCPVCANKRVLPGFNDLASQRPEIAVDWDEAGNGELTPATVYFRSTKKALWICRKGHSFQSSIRSRTDRGTGCAVCANQRVQKGVNDLASTHPELLAEWDHEANGSLSPYHLVARSEKKVYWRCRLGHSYQAIPYNRVNGSGCTVCIGQTVEVGFNDLASVRPDLAREWDYSKNSGGRPDQITAGSNKKFFWLCPKRHSYVSTVVHRVSGKGCPYCAGQKVLIGFNDLATTHPELAAKWDYKKNAPARPELFSMGTGRKFYWLCEKGHSHLAAINSKASGNGCPVCADQQVLAGYNDLGTLFPDIASEWDFDKNSPSTPQQVLRGTARKYFWLCAQGHSFKQAVVSRTYGGAGCPSCAKHGYDPTQAGILYFIENDKLRARKIGITNKETSVRYDRVKSFGADWRVLQLFEEADGYVIKKAESEVLKWIRQDLGLGQYLSVEDVGRGGGATETFSADGPSDQEIIAKISAALAKAGQRGPA